MSEKMHRPSPESNNHELNRSTPSQEDATKIQPKKTNAEIEEADRENDSVRNSVEAPSGSEEDSMGSEKGERR